jgi:hypothetical protein
MTQMNTDYYGDLIMMSLRGGRQAYEAIPPLAGEEIASPGGASAPTLLRNFLRFLRREVHRSEMSFRESAANEESLRAPVRDYLLRDSSLRSE